jgi:Predicted membrane protein (DUF2070).
MEGLPPHVRCGIGPFAEFRHFVPVLIVDTLTAMGLVISFADSVGLLLAADSTLDILETAPSHPFLFGFAYSESMDLYLDDIAGGRIATLCLVLHHSGYFLGWADADHMAHGVRGRIVVPFADNGYGLIEICTSDTPYTASGARNRNGYFQLGMLSIPNDLANWYLDLAKTAESKIKEGTFEVFEHQTNVKVMGPTIFSDYSKIMDKTMTLTKWCLLADAGLFAVSIFL